MVIWSADAIHYLCCYSQKRNVVDLAMLITFCDVIDDAKKVDVPNIN